MTATVNAVDYNAALEKFVARLGVPKVLTGRKFDRVFWQEGAGVYMIERATRNIYGVKSWTQVNPRRLYGTLDTIGEWDWNESPPTPVPGTTAAADHASREQAYVAGYKKRGRPRKNP
jgi:hypothetical protein